MFYDSSFRILHYLFFLCLFFFVYFSLSLFLRFIHASHRMMGQYTYPKSLHRAFAAVHNNHPRYLETILSCSAEDGSHYPRTSWCFLDNDSISVDEYDMCLTLSLLEFAAHDNIHACVKVLLDSNHENPSGGGTGYQWTPLHFAALAGGTETIAHMVHITGTAINIDCVTSGSYSGHWGYSGYDDDTGPLHGSTSAMHITPLFCCFLGEHVSKQAAANSATLLIENGADVNAVSGPVCRKKWYNGYGDGYCCFNGDAQRISGLTPLHMAVLSRNVQGVQCLIANGAHQMISSHETYPTFQAPSSTNAAEHDAICTDGMSSFSAFGVPYRLGASPMAFALAMHARTPHSDTQTIIDMLAGIPVPVQQSVAYPTIRSTSDRDGHNNMSLPFHQFTHLLELKKHERGEKAELKFFVNKPLNEEEGVDDKGESANAGVIVHKDFDFSSDIAHTEKPTLLRPATENDLGKNPIKVAKYVVAELGQLLEKIESIKGVGIHPSRSSSLSSTNTKQKKRRKAETTQECTDWNDIANNVPLTLQLGTALVALCDPEKAVMCFEYALEMIEPFALLINKRIQPEKNLMLILDDETLSCSQRIQEFYKARAPLEFEKKRAANYDFDALAAKYNVKAFSSFQTSSLFVKLNKKYPALAEEEVENNVIRNTQHLGKHVRLALADALSRCSGRKDEALSMFQECTKEGFPRLVHPTQMAGY